MNDVFKSPCPPPEGLTRELLTVLAEEASEVVQRVSKALRFGLDEVQPGQPYSNTRRLAHEVGDIYEVVNRLVAMGVLSQEQIDEGIARKKLQLSKFLQAPQTSVASDVFAVNGKTTLKGLPPALSSLRCGKHYSDFFFNADSPKVIDAWFSFWAECLTTQSAAEYFEGSEHLVPWLPSPEFCKGQIAKMQTRWGNPTTPLTDVVGYYRGVQYFDDLYSDHVTQTGRNVPLILAWCASGTTLPHALVRMALTAKRREFMRALFVGDVEHITYNASGREVTFSYGTHLQPGI